MNVIDFVEIGTCADCAKKLKNSNDRFKAEIIKQRLKVRRCIGCEVLREAKRGSL